VPDVQDLDEKFLHAISDDVRQTLNAGDRSGPAAIWELSQREDGFAQCDRRGPRQMRLMFAEIVLDVLQIGGGGEDPADADQD